MVESRSLQFVKIWEGRYEDDSLLAEDLAS